MILLITALIYLLINGYVIMRIRRWLGSCHAFFRKRWFQLTLTIVYLVPASSLLFAYLVPASAFQTFLKKFINSWLGVFVYILLACFLADIIGFVLRRMKKMPRRGSASYKKLLQIGGISMIVFVTLFSVYGSFHARDIKQKEYQITIDKKAGDLKKLRIGLISDLHLGYNMGIKDVEKMVNLLNEENLDLVCIAGDIYDNNFDAIDDPEGISQLLSQIQSTYGTFACFGNHDVSENLLGGFSVPGSSQQLRDTRAEQLLKDAGITILDDEVRLIDRSFYLVGRLDAHKTGISNLEPKTIEEFVKTLDSSKPILVMEHQPRKLKDEAKAGVDLSMAGHTHDGQLFPGNLVVALMWKNPYGLYKDGDFHSVVTSGVGMWGPSMRVGTDSEIAVIDVEFAG